MGVTESTQEKTDEELAKSIQEENDRELARMLQQEEDEDQFGKFISKGGFNTPEGGFNTPENINDPTEGRLYPRLPESDPTEGRLYPRLPAYEAIEGYQYPRVPGSESLFLKKTKRDKINEDFEQVKAVTTNPSSSISDKTTLINNMEKSHGDFLNSDPIKNLPLDKKIDKLEDHIMDLIEGSSNLSSPVSENSTDTIKSSSKKKRIKMILMTKMERVLVELLLNQLILIIHLNLVLVLVPITDPFQKI